MWKIASETGLSQHWQILKMNFYKLGGSDLRIAGETRS